MADYSKLFKKENQPDQTDADKLQAYTNHLDTYDPEAFRKDLKQKFEQNNADSTKAMEIAGRGMFQEKTPEEKQFEEAHLDPYTRGMMQGGFMGSVGTIGKIGQEVAQAGEAAFPRLKSMFNLGEKTVPAASSAEAMQIQEALRNSGQMAPKGFLGDTVVKTAAPTGFGKVTMQEPIKKSLGKVIIK